MSELYYQSNCGRGSDPCVCRYDKRIDRSLRARPNTSPVANQALGRLLTAGAMMGVMMKGADDILTIKIEGDGPIGGLTVTAIQKDVRVMPTTRKSCFRRMKRKAGCGRSSGIGV